MKTALLISCGQSLMLPVTDTENVPAPLLDNTLYAWTWLGYNYASPPLVYRRSPWRPVRRPKGVPGQRNFVGYDAAYLKTLQGLGVHGGLIQVAFGSTTMAVEWLPPAGAMYVQLEQEITLALASTASPVGDAAATPVVVLIDQGQSDANSAPDSAAYAANFAAFCTSLRAFLAPRTVYFVVCQTWLDFPACLGILPGATVPQMNQVRAGQAAWVAGDAGNSVLIDDQAFAHQPDGTHLTEAGSIAQGVAAANAAFALLP